MGDLKSFTCISNEVEFYDGSGTGTTKETNLNRWGPLIMSTREVVNKILQLKLLHPGPVVDSHFFDIDLKIPASKGKEENVSKKT